MNQEFGFAHPEIKCKLNQIYNSSFSGSMLWDFTSKNVNMLFNSWSVAVRIMWNLPYQTHRYLIEPLSGFHAKNMILSRFVNFVQSIPKGNKKSTHFLYELIKNDTRTITGKNINEIKRITDSDDIMHINVKEMKKSLKFKSIPDTEKWRIPLIKELTDIKQNRLEIRFQNGESLSFDDIDNLLSFAATV